MKTEGRAELELPFFVQDTKLAVLEQQLYGHVLAAIDLDALSNVEQHLAMILTEDFAMSDDLAVDLATQIMEAALRRVIDDPARYLGDAAPDGITEAEKEAVAFDETCQFCIAARQYQREAEASAARDEEACACCDMMRDAWREQHAEVLAKAGLHPGAARARQASDGLPAGSRVDPD